MLGIQLRKKVTLPKAGPKKTMVGPFQREGCLSYPMDKKGRIINEEAGYHTFELLSGKSGKGELSVAVLGVLGASKHILTDSFDRAPGPVGHGYHELEVHAGQLVAKNGAIEYDLGSWPPEELVA